MDFLDKHKPHPPQLCSEAQGDSGQMLKDTRTVCWQIEHVCKGMSVLKKRQEILVLKNTVNERETHQRLFSSRLELAEDSSVSLSLRSLKLVQPEERGGKQEQ